MRLSIDRKLDEAKAGTLVGLGLCLALVTCLAYVLVSSVKQTAEESLVRNTQLIESTNRSVGRLMR